MIHHSQVTFEWRGAFSNSELNRLHDTAFGTKSQPDVECDWNSLVERHSLGWVVARRGETLVGFVNVIWDGLAHAWLQDLVVSSDERHRGRGTEMVKLATEATRTAGCEWLHVDFGADLEPFYFDACGFRPTSAGLIRLC